MSTEYRRGIPGIAHIEAATRLGLLWEADDRWLHEFRFQNENVEVRYFQIYGPVPSDVGWEGPDTAIRRLSYRPIHPDGTPVDWETLDAEVARVARTAGTVQPQGFRADLWRRICRHFTGREICNMVSFEQIVSLNDTACHFTEWYWDWCDMPTNAATRADILTRWTVYQELKPLYDIVDGCPIGQAAPLPIDVFREWARNQRHRSIEEVLSALEDDTEHVNDSLILRRHSHQHLQLRGPYCSWYSDHPDEEKLRNFAAVLDAVAEQRVAERNATAAEPTPSVSPLREQRAPQSATPEPHRFSDVRPDRHGWRWWRLFGSDCSALGTLIEASPIHSWRVKDDPEADWHMSCHYNNAVDGIRTVIPTDEQGNPVSWESIGQGLSGNSIDAVLIDDALGPISPTQPTPLPRFTADELDDVDHSATTTQDSAILKRGKLPTVEAIGKYREVMAKRNGTVTEAVKASGIDCEVAQYVLERWAGGLSDREAEIICDKAYGAVSFTRADIAKRLSHWFAIIRTLDTSEPADTAAQRQRAEAAERQARMAALQAQLAKERAARVAEPIEELSRFALLEVDEAADPSKSIEAWKAQRAALKRASVVRPVPAPQPTPPPRRKAFEVVDAQADGLSGGAAFAVLLSRAMNQNC